MKKIIGLLLAISALLIPAIVAAGGGAEQPTTAIQAGNSNTRTVIDHMGNTVEIPTNPQRIGSLGDYELTIPLLELGAHVVGTHTSINIVMDKPMLRGAQAQLGFRLSDTEIIDYGQDIDLEQVKRSRPDLIIGHPVHASRYSLLSAIAPTVILDSGKARDYHKAIADISGRQEVYNQLYKTYQERIERLKRSFTVDTGILTATPIHYSSGQSQFRLYYNYSIQIPLKDMGFSSTSFEIKNWSNTWGGAYSLEVLPSILTEADYILFGYGTDIGEDDKSYIAKLSAIMPNWSDITTAYKTSSIFSFDWLKSGTYTFAAYNYILDFFEENAR